MTPDPLLARLREICLRQYPNLNTNMDECRTALEAELRALLADVAIEYTACDHHDPFGGYEQAIRARFGVPEKP